MRTNFKKTALGLALGATALAGIAPAAQARDVHGRRGGNSAGAAIVGGILGVAVGAAIASSGNHSRYNGSPRYNRSHARDGHNPNGYYYNRGYNGQGAYRGYPNGGGYQGSYPNNGYQGSYGTYPSSNGYQGSYGSYPNDDAYGDYEDNAYGDYEGDYYGR